ncbi:MAG: FAD-dependent oxidoreductase, partial [Candidatus Omnitrophica bacterium]|nr:FAD-dependent oxidoreductase [Candidatus Omnitrophota bacterium]
PYNAKFWTVPAQQLTCEWFDGFIPIPSLSQVVEGTVKENKKAYGYNAKFWYPERGGIEKLADAFARQIQNICTGCPVTEVNFKRKEVKTLKGRTEKFDYLVSTVALPELPGIIKDMPAEIIENCRRLRWNSIFNLNLGIDRDNAQDKHWIYFPEKDTSFFRVGFFHNFSENLSPAGKGSLYIEVSYSENKPIDKKGILLRIKRDLEKLNILRAADKIYASDINDIKYGYPIYDSSYSACRKEILDYLLQNKVFSCGRYGSWRYMTMEEALLDGKRAAQNSAHLLKYETH